MRPVSLLLLLVACGGSGSDPTDKSTTSSPTDPTDPTTPTTPTDPTGPTDTMDPTPTGDTATTPTSTSIFADVGQYPVAIDEECEGIPGLTGQAVLDAMLTHQDLSMGWWDGYGWNGDDLDLDYTWPTAPYVVTCFPDRDPRVAVSGLTMTVRDADGLFDETLEAVGFQQTFGGNIVFGPVVIAVTQSSAIQGTWTPPPGSAKVDLALRFNASLSTDFASGILGASQIDPAVLWTGAQESESTVAYWPY